ncbi:MAG: HAD hydrolase-like protein, partial [Ruminococcus sp.]|nr:HAD hydrolase-like protein [Ruminococcus sp.]
MNDFNTVLFDLDGTLTDSAPGIINCYRHALNAMGFEEPEDIMRVVGPPLYDSFAELCGMNSEQVQEAVRIYRQRYADTGLFENKVYDGIPEMLKRLKDSGKRLMVATSKPEVFAVRILEKFQLA